MRILLIDNYDSFSYNLVDLLKQYADEVVVVRNDLWQANAVEIDAVVLSPGPCTPAENGRLMEAVDYYCLRKPLLGVCLGHQAIGLHFGAQLVKAPTPMHGKTSSLFQLEASPLFDNIPSDAAFMRYHSLVLENLPAELVPLAAAPGNVLMAFAHKTLPVYGVQFHPESILSPFGATLIRNFVKLARLTLPTNYSIT